MKNLLLAILVLASVTFSQTPNGNLGQQNYTITDVRSYNTSGNLGQPTYQVTVQQPSGNIGQPTYVTVTPNPPSGNLSDPSYNISGTSRTSQYPTNIR